MPDLAIQVQNLGKRYTLGGARKPYKTLRESLLSAVAAPFKKSAPGKTLAPTEEGDPPNSFWALRDVSFDVAKGDRVGIIGRNGAGKSTLLKILARITDPTRGGIDINGRVGSLLEVGTGFHPELTGRENVYLNGAILGMKRGEIQGKFDEIVAFAETEKFLDTPVKYYSSGMYMRLAFAVAAHLEPEILIVDEVLAVGDAAFQKKCLGKMQQIGGSGRTVLFVSHNIGAVRAICNKAVYLESGRVKMVGDAEPVTLKYMSRDDAGAGGLISASQHLRGNGDVRLDRATLLADDGTPKESFLVGEPVNLKLNYSVKTPSAGTFWVFVNGPDGTVIFSSFQTDSGGVPHELAADSSAKVRLTVPSFLPGSYTMTAGIFSRAMELLDWADTIARFEVLPQYADGRPFDHRYGMLTAPTEWTVDAPVAR